MRDPGNTKPWLAYIEFKLKHGAIMEQAFVMERACMQLPRSYKLWKMVRAIPFDNHYTTNNERTINQNVYLVSAFPHEARFQAQCCCFRPRVQEGQFTVRKGSDSAQQDAAHMGDVSQLPPFATTRHPNETHLRSGSTSIAHNPTQPDMGAIPTLCELGSWRDRCENLETVHAGSS